ncbi:hypothetical protein [Methylobacterium nodulans]|uniref:hypothetical protein n=1 Tax=Methylobacterium nodulans TaxID=114616 RepID=UPI0012ED0B55|nr:hypothetical protein [Methylobacterium nodulans]
MAAAALLMLSQHSIEGRGWLPPAGALIQPVSSVRVGAAGGELIPTGLEKDRRHHRPFVGTLLSRKMRSSASYEPV